MKAKYVAAAAVIVFLVVFIWGGGAEHETDVPNWAVQNAIALEANGRVIKKTVTIKHMDVLLQQHDAAVTLAITASKFGQDFSMIIHAVGQPDINHRGHGALYFRATDVKFDEPVWTGKKPSELIQQGAERYTEGHPNLRRALEDIAPHADTWAKKFAEEAAVDVLNNVPIYKFQGTKGFFLNAAVKSAVVQDGNLVIVWSLWEFTERAIIFGIILIVVAVLFVGALFADL